MHQVATRCLGVAARFALVAADDLGDVDRLGFHPLIRKSGRVLQNQDRPLGARHAIACLVAVPHVSRASVASDLYQISSSWVTSRSPGHRPPAHPRLLSLGAVQRTFNAMPLIVLRNQ
jgi:hypothetical protein